MKILAVNPGSTSTKIAVYEDETPRLVLNIRHSVEELSQFPRIIDQFEFRKHLVLEALEANDIPFKFDAIVGRGGLLKPIPGCLIAHELAAMLPGCPSFIADPGVVDELDDVARITGSPLMPSITIWHALNQRAIARRYAAERSALQPEAPVHYEDLNLIVCHLGGGVSVGVHRHGRAVDVPNALDGFGPFSPERAGTLPAGQLIDLCHSGRYTTEELKKRISGKAGLAAHLGTTDIPAIERRIAEGDTHAALVLDAMIYRIAKEIGGAAVVLYGKVDAILLTGGMAHSEYITSRLQERVSFLAPVHVYPGEDELEALVMNALGALRGELPVQVYR